MESPYFLRSRFQTPTRKASSKRPTTSADEKLARKPRLEVVRSFCRFCESLISSRTQDAVRSVFNKQSYVDEDLEFH